jgi:hypothetical protein
LIYFHTLIFVGFFIVLHAIFASLPKFNFGRAFKVSRGVAALLLSVVGFFAIFSDLQNWSQAFIYFHSSHSQLEEIWYWCMHLCLGHFWADLLWLFWGRIRYKVDPRKDLIIHHLIGIIAFSYALYHQLAYPACLITMASELMPVTTGLSAYGQRIKNLRLVKWSKDTRLKILIWWRVPLWTAMSALSLTVLISKKVAPGLLLPYIMGAAGFAALLFLDRFWIKQCLAAEN